MKILSQSTNNGQDSIAMKAIRGGIVFTVLLAGSLGIAGQASADTGSAGRVDRVHHGDSTSITERVHSDDGTATPSADATVTPAVRDGTAVAIPHYPGTRYYGP